MGDRVLALRGGKTARADLYRDVVTHSTIGFWTDIGGYYHYSTGTGSTKFPNGSYIYNQSYEEVLPKVKASHDAAGVPFGHWQFDSWFYPKDATVGPGGGGGGVTLDRRPSDLPVGNGGDQQGARRDADGDAQPPVVAHSRTTSRHLAFTWHTGSKAGDPRRPAAFFTWFFTTQQQGWGLAMYEQDWMCTEYDEVEALQTNVNARGPVAQGDGPGRRRVASTVQYYMPYPNDILSGYAHAAVTNAARRATTSRANHQWAVGGTALFYWALGMLRSKDGFSSTHPQVGGQTVGPETDPDREALMATLSGAMVGPMDGIGLLNVSRTCQLPQGRRDPQARPSRSPRRLVLQGQGRRPGCFVYHTFGGTFMWPWRLEEKECRVQQLRQGIRTRYLYIDDGKDDTVTADMLYLSSSSPPPAVLYDWYSEYRPHGRIPASRPATRATCTPSAFRRRASGPCSARSTSTAMPVSSAAPGWSGNSRSSAAFKSASFSTRDDARPRAQAAGASKPCGGPWAWPSSSRLTRLPSSSTGTAWLVLCCLVAVGARLICSTRDFVYVDSTMNLHPGRDVHPLPGAST